MKPDFLPFSHLREDSSGAVIREDYPMSKEELLCQVMKSVREGLLGQGVVGRISKPVDTLILPTSRCSSRMRRSPQRSWTAAQV